MPVTLATTSQMVRFQGFSGWPASLAELASFKFSERLFPAEEGGGGGRKEGDLEDTRVSFWLPHVPAQVGTPAHTFAHCIHYTEKGKNGKAPKGMPLVTYCF